jgi:NitT/TauT family transport system substrate-binding protein
MESFWQSCKPPAARRRSAVWAAILAFGAALLSTTVTMGRAEAAQALEKASLRLKWPAQAQFAGFYVARDKGFYNEAGIELTINPGDPNVDVEDLVASGSDTFGLTGGVTSHLVARDKGLPLVAIGVAHLKTPYSFVTYDDSGIEKLEDFKGRTVSAWFTGMQHTLRAMLATTGLKDGDYRLVPQQAATMSPFIEREVDVAVATLYNEYLTLQEQGITNLRRFQPDDFGITAQRDTLIATAQTIKEEPELVQRFLNATLKGWQYALRHQDEAVGIIMEADPSLDRVHQESMLKVIEELMMPDGATMLFEIQYDVLQRQQDILLSAGVLSKPADVRAAFDDGFLKAAPGDIKKP